jgi:subtilase family serine protease
MPARAQQNSGSPIQSVDPVSTTSRGPLTVSIHLPLRNSEQLDALIQAQADEKSPQYRHWITPQQFRATYGPDSRDIQAAKQFLESQGFAVTQTSQSLFASGTQRQVESSFGVHMREAMSANRATLSADGPAKVPQALSSLHATIAVGQFRFQTGASIVSGVTLPFRQPQNRESSYGGYWYNDLKEAYEYPSYQRYNGLGRTIAIVAASDVLDSDTQAYFDHEHFTGYLPVQRRHVNGGRPFDPKSGDSQEAALDVQQSLGSALGAQVVLYDIPSLNDADTLPGFAAVIDDNRADIVSISFTECELDFTKAYNGGHDNTFILQHFHDLFRQGNAQGITFVAATGDYGSKGCLSPITPTTKGPPNVLGIHHPAADPNVTAVGGTNLQTAFVPGHLTSTYVSENAFPDQLDMAASGGFSQWGSGGGVSTLFPKPLYQQLVNTGSAMRTIPDVSMHMGGCPTFAVQCQKRLGRSFVYLAFSTQATGIFLADRGTSAASPEFAGLVAVLEQRLGGVRMGNINSYIYALAAARGAAAFHNNIPGSNGYPSNPGYNYVVGNGTPIAAVFAQDPSGPVAGDPQTPSNP